MGVDEMMKVAGLIRDFEHRLELIYGIPVKGSFEFTSIGNVNVNRILDCVATITGITVDQMKSPSRKDDVVSARFIAFKCLSDLMAMNSSAIGRIFNRDHSTVLHGLKKQEDLFFSDAKFRNHHNIVLKLLSRENIPLTNA